jgi:hypothetical protein
MKVVDPKCVHVKNEKSYVSMNQIYFEMGLRWR